MIITAGLWLNSASAIHSDQVTSGGVWLFFAMALSGSLAIFILTINNVSNY